MSFHNRPRKYRSFFIFLLLLLAGLLLYAPITEAPFVFDDQLIFDEPRLLWTDLTFDNLAGLTGVEIDNVSPRIVSHLTFALNYYLGRRDPTGYHLFNLAVHVLTAFLLYLIARRIPAGHDYRWPAAVAALLWLAHPLQVQSVTYIWQRMNSLAALFYMLAFFLYIKARQGRSAGPGRRGPVALLLAGCFVSGLLAIGSKQSAVTLPLTLFIYEWFFFQEADPAWLKKHLAWLALAVAAVAGPTLLLLDGSPLAAILLSYADKSFTLGQRLLTEPGVILYYLSLLAWPHPARLSLDYDFPLATALTMPALASLAGLAGLVAAGFRLIKSHRPAAFAVFWFLINLLPESSVMGLELMCSYRLYLPSVFLFIALAGLLPASGRPARTAVMVAGLVIVIGGMWTFQRNLLWQNDLVLWQDTVRKSPDLAWPRHNLGLALSARGRQAEAVRQYQRALAIKKKRLGPNHPETAKSYSNLGVAHDRQGDLEKASGAYHRALSIYLRHFGRHDLRTAAVYNNLGVLHGRAGDYERARTYCRRALDARLALLGPEHPGTAEIYNNLGMASQGLRDTDRAGFYFKKALGVLEKHLGPDHPRVVRTRASLRRLERAR
ncbi:MAG: tetratricopeptide repeat protein [Desulfosudaceae bacterium]